MFQVAMAQFVNDCVDLLRLRVLEEVRLKHHKPMIPGGKVYSLAIGGQEKPNLSLLNKYFRILLGQPFKDFR